MSVKDKASDGRGGGASLPRALRGLNINRVNQYSTFLGAVTVTIALPGSLVQSRHGNPSLQLLWSLSSRLVSRFSKVTNVIERYKVSPIWVGGEPTVGSGASWKAG